jgi:hypothetical protein
MSGAADDWVYEHLGIFGWTSEFWDVIHTVTGNKQSTHFWYTGPTEDEEVAVARWADQHHPEMIVAWYPFDHPQLGPVELGGWDEMCTWTNPPLGRLAQEVEGHAEVAIAQAEINEIKTAFITVVILFISSTKLPNLHPDKNSVHESHRNPQRD